MIATPARRCASRSRLAPLLRRPIAAPPRSTRRRTEPPAMPRSERHAPDHRHPRRPGRRRRRPRSRRSSSGISRQQLDTKHASGSPTRADARADGELDEVDRGLRRRRVPARGPHADPRRARPARRAVRAPARASVGSSRWSAPTPAACSRKSRSAAMSARSTRRSPARRSRRSSSSTTSRTSCRISGRADRGVRLVVEADPRAALPISSATASASASR